MTRSLLLGHPLPWKFRTEKCNEDCPQLLGYQATISAPSMHAKAVELLLRNVLPLRGEKHEKGEETVIGIQGRPRRILDIGSGSGFLVQVFAELADERSVIIGVDHIEELRQLGEHNMCKYARGAAFVASNRETDGKAGQKIWETLPLTITVVGNGIHVGAAAVRWHSELVQQLRSPDRLFIPVAEEEGNWFSDVYI
ncbi:hypothetical protein RRF57_007367 [Xylaria bambusicola]|uniref:protein-L-isoaspartate(D-aspartate) O-methyltransferase n=1 Tax=Xylaria bambusicola TaxID=326684 RepID=A0AAN7URW2_9PEZI